MTVAELIKLLEELPQDAEINYVDFSRSEPDEYVKAHIEPDGSVCLG